MIEINKKQSNYDCDWCRIYSYPYLKTVFFFFNKTIYFNKVNYFLDKIRFWSLKFTKSLFFVPKL